ncbi:hypothetical protein [Streptomyces cinereoruber]
MPRLRQQQSPPGTTSETVPVHALLAPDGAGRVPGARVGATGGQPVL